MIDNYFRAQLARRMSPVVRLLADTQIHPNQITVLGFVTALVSAFLVAEGFLLAGCVVWWLSRAFDALDGLHARVNKLSTEFGGYLDIQLDMAAYSTMILALHLRFPEFALQWALMLFGYVLCISGALGLGNLTKTSDNDLGVPRQLRIATGLAEGGETGAAYTVFLLLPQYLMVTTWLWIAVLFITVLARFSLAKRELS